MISDRARPGWRLCRSAFDPGVNGFFSIRSPNPLGVQYASRSLVGIGLARTLRLLFVKTQGAFVNLLPSKKKGRRTARVGLAVVTTAALVSIGLASPAAAEHDGRGKSDATTLPTSGTGLLAQLLAPLPQALIGNTRTYDYTGSQPGSTGGGNGGTGIGPVPATYQYAGTGRITDFPTLQNQVESGANFTDNTSAAAGTTGINLNLTRLSDLVTETNTDPTGLLGGTTDLLDAVLQLALVGILSDVDDAVQGVLDTLLESPIVARVGSVDAWCDARPGSATASGRVAGIDVVLDLPGAATDVNVNLPVGELPANSAVVANLGNITTALVASLTASLNASLGTLGMTLGALTQALQTQVLNQVVAALTPVFQALSDGLGPILTATINRTTSVPTGTAAPFTVTGSNAQVGNTALELRVLEGIQPLSGTLSVGNVNCGPNTAGTPHGGGENPGLQVLKTEKVNGDDEAEWTIRVHNPLNSAVDDVFVKDFYPKELDEKDVKVSSISKGSFNKNTGVWTVGTLAAGATETLRIKAEVDEDDLSDGIDNAICVNRTSKPNHIQKNDTFKDDTDGCDTANAKSDADDDDDDSPKSINSGISGGDLSAGGLAGLLAMTAMGGSLARRRFNT